MENFRTLRKKSRRQMAKELHCAECGGQAVDFCGAWIQDGTDLGAGRECHTALCKTCALIIGDVWLCRDHQKKSEPVEL